MSGNAGKLTAQSSCVTICPAPNAVLYPSRPPAARPPRQHIRHRFPSSQSKSFLPLFNGPEGFALQLLFRCGPSFAAYRSLLVSSGRCHACKSYFSLCVAEEKNNWSLLLPKIECSSNRYLNTTYFSGRWLRACRENGTTKSTV